MGFDKMSKTQKVAAAALAVQAAALAASTPKKKKKKKKMPAEATRAADLAVKAKAAEVDAKHGISNKAGAAATSAAKAPVPGR